MNYKGFNVDELNIVRNKNGFKVMPDANGFYYVPPHEKITIEQLKELCQPQTATQIKEIKQIATQIDVKQESATQKIDKGRKIIENAKKGAPKGINNGNSDGYYTISGKRYESAQQAHEQTGIRLNTLIRYCKLGCSFEPKQP